MYTQLFFFFYLFFVNKSVMSVLLLVHFAETPTLTHSVYICNHGRINKSSQSEDSKAPPDLLVVAPDLVSLCSLWSYAGRKRHVPSAFYLIFHLIKAVKNFLSYSAFL